MLSLIVDIFTKSIYPHINAQTKVYNPPNENSDPSLSSEYMLIKCHVHMHVYNNYYYHYYWFDKHTTIGAAYNKIDIIGWWSEVKRENEMLGWTDIENFFT